MVFLVRFLAVISYLTFCLAVHPVAFADGPGERLAPSNSRQTNGKPNIVVILADDLGYGDVRPLNPESKIPTPHFDRLAREGITFTDGHTPSAVCTPTRYGLLCGRYSWRTSMKRGVLNGYSPPLLQPDRQTIGSVLQAAGYTTACIGKWHLGLGWQWRDTRPDDLYEFRVGKKKQRVDFSKPVTDCPIHHGFDQSYIIPASLDFSPYVYLKNDRVVKQPNRIIPAKPFPKFYRRAEISPDFKHVDTLDHLLAKAQGFINEQAKNDDPFFLYFPLSAPHKPVIPHPRFHDKTKLGDYGDFVMQVDWTVGQILKTLDEAGVNDETLVVVTSDNGSFMYRQENDPDHTKSASAHFYHPRNHRANGPLRGTKADIWEAGHRVPFFVRMPKSLEGGKRIGTPVCQTDLLATLAEVAGAEFDRKSAEDSFSFLPLLQGKQSETVRPPIIHQSGSGFLAIRDGNWKLVLANGSGGREKPRGTLYGKPYQLFDLSQDIDEQKNVADQHPELVSKMVKRFEEIAHGDQIQPTPR